MKVRLFAIALIVVSIAFVLNRSIETRPAVHAQGMIDQRSRTFNELEAKTKASGSVRVIVGLKLDFKTEGNLRPGDVSKQRLDIKAAQADFRGRYSEVPGSAVKLFDYIPFLATEIDSGTLRQMETDPGVVSIQEDIIGEAALTETIPMVGANTAWANGYTGAGQTVAIVDSGVDKNHSFLSPRVVSEACYSSTVAGTSISVCPGGVTESTAADSGLNCPVSIDGCAHGTNVAGIAAGSGVSFSGVAKGANIVAIQIFSQFTSSTTCQGPTPCARYFTSDLIKGLERVRTLKTTIPSLQAVNLSLQTGQQFTSNCDVAHAATKAAVDNLRSLGVATIICAGNFSFTNALTAPACISSSISVGSVDDGSLGTSAGVVSSFSDSSPLLHILAPGRWVNSSIPGNLFQNYSGTSMATPHVVGGFALMRQKYPNASIGQIVKSMTMSGVPTTDSRNGIVKPRLDVNAALAVVNRYTPFDFDDDGKTDISIYRAGPAEWWYSRSMDGGVRAVAFGGFGDVQAPGDFTGDGKTDVTVWRPSNSTWYVLRSEDSSFFSFPFGLQGDIPTPADFDGDGKTDAAQFRPSTGTWFIPQSGGGGTIFAQFGADGDLPVAADYDGDGKADIGIIRRNAGNLEWWIQRSTAGFFVTIFGVATDKAVPGDYTGDGKIDVAAFRPSTGTWFVLRSEDSSFFSFPWGQIGDIPAPGDYDGDGKWDSAVFRPSVATWFVNRTGGSGPLIAGFGAPTDQPVASLFVR